jgi:uncharacterized protein YdhG (YjbR/CyaY superfamily)
MPTSPIDAYIAKQTPAAQPALRQVRDIIRTLLPGAEERISYGIPTYGLDGRPVVYFAGWKQHFSIYPVTAPIRQSLDAALAKYELSKGTVRFPLDQPVPIRLVQRIVRALARAAAERSKARAKVTPRASTRGRARTSGRGRR